MYTDPNLLSALYLLQFLLIGCIITTLILAGVILTVVNRLEAKLDAGVKPQTEQSPVLSAEVPKSRSEERVQPVQS